MTEKETLIARLKELGVKLDREVNVTGTIQELTLRISELEEELDEDEDEEEGAEVSVASTTAISTSAQPGPENTSGSITENPASNEPGELVAVETLVTLHIDALHATRNESLSIVEPGVVIRVTDAEATALISQGLAREV
ncbi:DNA-packaging protein FI [Enterobacter bugandensis]|uniref:DNA-packaging protein FI n=1 Tax=Enterobacter bugandensis TaxID=881260 RepID=UPI0022DF1CB8|nr:DNA-packaging protein FI [Enterobacter bugandensis]